ncbi:MAG: type III effector [Pseudozobellia sp.]|nr:type III effector [Pseudozobellia sp.]MBG46683.1 type III effector [Pseudozobellia sp.]|tara:strand:- start:27 stop:368 length:342 start_codon:yes stop_codon:yes gene_type:complete
MLTEFLKKLRNTPQDIEFSDTMAVIEALYYFEPTSFKNGQLINKTGENSGSCKLLAFAQDQELSKEETLACFGSFYFDDVLNDPRGNGHQNIRNFMQTSFGGLHFDRFPLRKK